MAEDPEVVPEQLQWEILKLLPVKSLMRFKCVSATWNSIISDPAFAKARCGGSRGLLFYELNFNAGQPGFSGSTNVYFSPLLGPSSQFSHFITLREGYRVTNVVNGLVCIYSRNHSWLYNIATRERMELPSLGDEDMGGSCYLGFDPISNLFKLLWLCPISLTKGPWKCKILRIGLDSCWRDIRTKFTQVAIARVGYSDGVLYWWKRWIGDDTNEVEEFLTAFDLCQETFRFITLKETDNKYRLPHFGPLATMYPFIDRSGMRQGLVVHHSYRRDVAGKAVETIWVKDDLFVQPSQAFTTVCFEGILPNGKVLISHPDNFPASFYLFDPMKRGRQAQEISIEAGPSFPKHVNWSRFVRCYYEENIISLKCLISAPEHYATLGFDSHCPVQYVMPFGI